MTNEKVEFDVKTAYGKDLPSPVHVGPFTVSIYETENEIPAGERLTSDQYVAAVNARIKAKARAAQTTKALDAAGISKPDQNDPAVMRDNMVKLIMKLHGVDENTARKIQEATESAAAAVSA